MERKFFTLENILKRLVITPLVLSIPGIVLGYADYRNNRLDEKFENQQKIRQERKEIPFTVIASRGFISDYRAN